MMEEHSDTFINSYSLNYRSFVDISIILTYFAFTTLSTVGFGDFVPKSDTERIIGSAVLFLGVMLFSTIMGEFVEIIRSFKEYDKDLDDGIRLE